MERNSEDHGQRITYSTSEQGKLRATVQSQPSPTNFGCDRYRRANSSTTINVLMLMRLNANR